MKHLFYALCLFTGLQASGQQPGQFPVEGKPARVTSWSSRAIYIISDKYFDETKDSIIALIGTAEFEAMSAHCSRKGWPGGLYSDDFREAESAAFDRKLDSLKLYHIGAYTHIFNGKTFSRYAILRVPYAENAQWDEKVQWEENVYFLLQ